jgi:hypothetical protein
MLGTVPGASRATTAAIAGTAATASTATNAAKLAGSPPSAYQSRVSGTCAAGSGIRQVNADGTASCGPASFYNGRVVIAVNAPRATFLTSPGIVHVSSLNCQAGGADAELQNDGKGTDLWTAGDTNYVGTNWLAANTTYGKTGGATWHLGTGTGAGAKVVAVTVSTEATGTSCIFQGFAEVMTS